MRTHLKPGVPDDALTQFDRLLLSIVQAAEQALEQELRAEHLDFAVGQALVDFRWDTYAYLDAMSRQHERPDSITPETDAEWQDFFTHRARIVRQQVRDEALARWAAAKTHANANIKQWRADRLVRHQGTLPLPEGTGVRGDLLSALGISRLSEDAKRLTSAVKQVIVAPAPEESDETQGQPQPPQRVTRTVPAPTLKDRYDDGW